MFCIKYNNIYFVQNINKCRIVIIILLIINSNYNYTFPVNLSPDRIPIDGKSIEKKNNYYPNLVFNFQKLIFVCLCIINFCTNIYVYIARVVTKVCYEQNICKYICIYTARIVSKLCYEQNIYIYIYIKYTRLV